MPEEKQKQVIYRHAYVAPDYWVKHVVLDVDIRHSDVQVRSTLSVQRNPEADRTAALVLQGRGQILQSIMLDGRALDDSEYVLTETTLSITQLPEHCELSITSSIDPDKNTSLEGFYRSGDILCTQCEAHGFSRITYFPDRPDILSTYQVSITADQQHYPVLLANGNLKSSENLASGLHRVVWEDPYPKPCYLFAMVAGDLSCVEDRFTTASGRDIAIQFYVEEGNESRCDQAIHALKEAMAWDERAYGLEYDLDLYMVVAVGSFNMGAMENKGLNIFNSRFVLASSDTATDTDYELIQAVIGHEYFHNWTGNRVTCRDWFQLSLKEGLTVFREQQFMEDSLASSTQRIEHVQTLRSHQFSEDASPASHPVRPDSYIEVNNFYTMTVYEKGSELIRMMRNQLGQAAFSAGVKHYLSKHDGEAATIDEFMDALSEHSGQDMHLFADWYSQSGTPEISVKDSFDQTENSYTLHIEQRTPPTHDQVEKKALPIPISLALLDPEGNIQNESSLLLTAASQQHVIENISARPIPVFLRDFSAPVKLQYLYSRTDLCRIAEHESDGFSRWDAMQRVYVDLISNGMSEAQLQTDELIELCQKMLARADEDQALAAELLRMPSELLLSEEFDPIPVESLVAARDRFESGLASGLQTRLLSTYNRLNSAEEYVFNGEAAGRRRLKNLCLYYLAQVDEAGQVLAYRQFEQADNMTDRMGALEALNHVASPLREAAMQQFANDWRHEPLVMDKWYALQATSRLPAALERVQTLHASADYDRGNPNRLRALVGSFCLQNLRGFHRADGAAYQWLAAEIMRLDSINPQVASRLSAPLCRWQRQTADKGEMMQAALRTVAAKPGLSADVYEQVSRALQ